MDKKIESKTNIRIPPLFKQVYVISGVVVGHFSMGACDGFPAIMFPQLKGNTSIPPELLEPLFLAAYTMTQAPTMPLVQTLMQYRGRRFAYFANAIPLLMGWLVIYFFANFSALVIGGILIGITSGGIDTCDAIIISEYSAPKYRGAFLVMKASVHSLGIWFVNLLGTFFHWRTVSLILIVPAALELIMVYTWKESPAWLAKKGRYEESETNFRWLRGRTEESERELRIMIDIQQENHIVKNRETKLSFVRKIRLFRKRMTEDIFWKPLLIVLISFSLYVFTAKLILATYAIEIYTDMSQNQDVAYLAMNVYGATTFVGLVASCFIVNFVSRRLLLLSTSAIGAFFMLLASLWIYLEKISFFPFQSYYISFIFLLGHNIAISLGTTPLSISIFGEIIPLEHRELCGAIGATFYGIFYMITIELTPTFIKAFNVEGFFLFCSISMFVCTAYLFKHLPETKGRTLQEIEDFYRFGRFVERKCSLEGEVMLNAKSFHSQKPTK